MRTFELIKGLPVITGTNGENLGTVTDLCIAEGKVTGLIVSKRNFLKQKLYLDYSKVLSIGPDGIIISSPEELEKGITKSIHTLSHQSPIAGKMVMTSEGRALGVLHDVYFNDEVGTIVGYEISDGFFSDLQDGKKIIKSGGAASIGKDTIIVTPEMT
ncbi:hypothetical protein A8F94_04945 [Bacillus sp. FJAT-27225]|uniref:PRC-barrel domain-containing protein n=1 Tax=Bacillus sp. FJAT-27225 TaxID=1743144 RepID=UPI00080C3156|nr:PRC-barrel domain-containing protein [Bacillus sp. FJAT-27225]OCA91210.1 hypothetical protein A8F94_04945 [Bacillus sp. FJAT-27225]